MAQHAKIFEALLTSQRAQGVTLSGGKAYFYVPSETLKTIYEDRNKQTVAANPFTLDSNGQATVYGDGLYDIQVKNSTLSVSLPLWEDVNIQELAGETFANIADYADLEAAVSAIGATPTTLIIGTNQSVANNLTIPATLELMPINKAIITIASGKTLTINGTVTFPDSQIFAGSGTVAFSAVKSILPEWWGAVTDGATDSTSAWNKACDCARLSRSDTQGTIPVEASNSALGYYAVGPIQAGGVTLQGNNALFTHEGGTDNILFQVIYTDRFSVTLIEGFEFRSKTTSSTGKCIVFGYVDGDANATISGAINVTIRNNTWHQYSGTSLYCRNLDSAYIYNNHFIEGRNGYAILSFGDVETFSPLTHYVFNGIVIKDNRINSHDRYTGATYQAIKVDGTSVKIDGNMIISAKAGAIWAGYKSEGYAFTVSNNYMEDNGAYHIKVGEASANNYSVRGMTIEGNRLAGGISLTEPSYMVNALLLNKALGCTIKGNFINNALYTGGDYYGYTGKIIEGNSTYNEIVSIYGNSFIDPNRYSYDVIGNELKKSPGFSAQLGGVELNYEVPFGLSKITDVAAGTTVTDTFILHQNGRWQVDLFVYGNGITDKDVIAGSWIVTSRDSTTDFMQASAQIVAPYTHSAAITSLALSAPVIAGSDHTLTATLVQTNNATAKFYWHVKMLMPLPLLSEL